MRRAQLIAQGVRLAADLDAASERYHVKSDQRTILEYESAAVTAYARFLAYGTPVADNLKASALLGEWGQSHAWEESDLLRRTAAFHAALREVLT